jgi:hypothetical protein
LSSIHSLDDFFLETIGYGVYRVTFSLRWTFWLTGYAGTPSHSPEAVGSLFAPSRAVRISGWYDRYELSNGLGGLLSFFVLLSSFHISGRAQRRCFRFTPLLRSLLSHSSRRVTGLCFSTSPIFVFFFSFPFSPARRYAWICRNLVILSENMLPPDIGKLLGTYMVIH